MLSQGKAESYFVHQLLFIFVICFINGLVSPQPSITAIDSQLATFNTTQDSSSSPSVTHPTLNGQNAFLDQSNSSDVIHQQEEFPSNFSISNATFQNVNQTHVFLKDQDLSNNNSSIPNQAHLPEANNIHHINFLEATHNSSGVPLETKITVPFSILGAILIASGGPMCFWGGRNRWSSYFLTGAYLAAVIVMVPILRFGVIEQDHPPSNVVQGIFVLACIISAIGSGAVSVIFWKGTRFIVGAGGGFVISLFLLSLRSNAVIRPLGLRYILILGCIAVGFVLATVPAISLYVTLFATAAMGAAAVVLGIDCFTTGGLKEFWLYILGFGGLFPKLTYFPFTITIQAELGVMAALFVMGAAIQWRLLEIIMKKIKELKQLDRDRMLEEEAAAYRQSMILDADLVVWEKRHGDEEQRRSSRHSQIPPSTAKEYHYQRPVSKNYSQHRVSKTPSACNSFNYELVPRLSDPFAPAPPRLSERPSVERSPSFPGLPPIKIGNQLDVSS